jgi:hypothetical protein
MKTYLKSSIFLVLISFSITPLFSQNKAWGIEYEFANPTLVGWVDINDTAGSFQETSISVQGLRLFYLRYGNYTKKTYFKNGFGFEYLKMTPRIKGGLEDAYLLSWQLQFTFNFGRFKPFLGSKLAFGYSSQTDSGWAYLLGLNTGLQLYLTDRLSVLAKAEYISFINITNFPLYGGGLVYDF